VLAIGELTSDPGELGMGEAQAQAAANRAARTPSGARGSTDADGAGDTGDTAGADGVGRTGPPGWVNALDRAMV